MKQVYCPICKKLLFKAEFADVEIKCGSCKRIVRVTFFTQKALLLTPDSIADNIEEVENIEEQTKDSKSKEANNLNNQKTKNES